MKVVSGGQTGVDRAALDAAISVGLEVGGWCPAGRVAEDSLLDRSYALTETPSSDPAQRTEWNVRDSDATLVIVRGEALLGGTNLTVEIARRLSKPLVILQLVDRHVADQAIDWIRGRGVSTLNIAGPRESEEPGIYELARPILIRILSECAGGPAVHQE
jgi:hypothetical protein